MVGFNPYAQFELSPLDYSVAGVASGVVTRIFCQPLDVLKIRFQLQIDPIKRKCGKYQSMTQASKLIVKEEGVSAMWKGHVPAQGLSVLFGMVQFGSYEILTRYVWTYLPRRLATDYYPFTNFTCGGLSGALAMTAALPLDVVRTRLIAQGEPRMYRNFTQAISLMYRKEGVLSFYRGFVPTIVQIAPYTGFQFCFYTIMVRFWNSVLRGSDNRDTKISAIESAVCGSLAGTGAKMAVYPLDLLKKRLQVIGFEKARLQFGTVHKYRGLFHCIGSILKYEGTQGMFKGLAPSLLKAAISSGTGFFVYEQVCHGFLWFHSHRTITTDNGV